MLPLFLLLLDACQAPVAQESTDTLIQNQTVAEAQRLF